MKKTFKHIKLFEDYYNPDNIESKYGYVLNGNWNPIDSLQEEYEVYQEWVNLKNNHVIKITRLKNDVFTYISDSEDIKPIAIFEIQQGTSLIKKYHTRERNFFDFLYEYFTHFLIDNISISKFIIRGNTNNSYPRINIYEFANLLKHGELFLYNMIDDIFNRIVQLSSEYSDYAIETFENILSNIIKYIPNLLNILDINIILVNIFDRIQKLSYKKSDFAVKYYKKIVDLLQENSPDNLKYIELRDIILGDEDESELF